MDDARVVPDSVSRPLLRLTAAAAGGLGPPPTTRFHLRRSRPTEPASLLVLVQLSSKRTRQAVRQDCCFGKKQESPAALLVVVQRRGAGVGSRRARLCVNAGVVSCPFVGPSSGIHRAGLAGHVACEHGEKRSYAGKVPGEGSAYDTRPGPCRTVVDFSFIVAT
jgi:hypothetical protein